MAGRTEAASKSESFQVSVPKDTCDYLKLLATKGKLGGSHNEIGAFLITREVEKMQLSGFHNLTF